MTEPRRVPIDARIEPGDVGCSIELRNWKVIANGVPIGVIDVLRIPMKTNKLRRHDLSGEGWIQLAKLAPSGFGVDLDLVGEYQGRKYALTPLDASGKPIGGDA
ncbi:MAG: hypothetical protein AAGI17_01980 [Planctomycetota bacterium]